MAESEVPETIATYLRLRGLEPSKRYKKKRRVVDDDDENAPFAPGRDPKPLGEAIDVLTRSSGWEPHLQREDLALNWEEIAGAENAAHSHIETFSRGVVVVRCDSTPRSKQMHMMRSHFLTRVIQLYPQAGVTDIRFFGPDVPSWNHGIRRVPGRGPRDTYG